MHLTNYWGLSSADRIEGWLWTTFVYASMVDYHPPANFLMPLPAYPITEVFR